MNNTKNAAFCAAPLALPENAGRDNENSGNAPLKPWALGFPKIIDPDGRELFPVHMLPPVLSEFVKEVCETRAVPTGLVGPAVLVAVSTSLGAGVEIETWEGLRTRGNLYWLGIASSGAGKGLASNEAFGPIFAAEKKRIEDWRIQLPQIWAAADIKKTQLKKATTRAAQGDVNREEAFNECCTLRQQLGTLERLKLEPRLTCEDVTREKLGDLLAAHPRECLASVSAEARGMLDVLTRLKGEDLYTKAWSGEVYRNDRRSTASVHLNQPCLSVAWLLQEDVWSKLVANESFVASGLLPRFLVSAPEVPIGPLPLHSRQVDARVASAYAELLHSLLGRYHDSDNDSLVVHVPDAVASLFRDYENDIRSMRSPGGHFQDVASFAARWTQNAFRIALVLHAATHGSTAHDHPLSPSIAQSALFIMDWFRTEQIRLLSGRIAQADIARANRLEEAIRRYPNGTATIRDLTTRNGFKEPEVVALAERLPERFRIFESRAGRGSKGGRPSRSVELVLPFTNSSTILNLISGIAGSGGIAA